MISHFVFQVRIAVLAAALLLLTCSACSPAPAPSTPYYHRVKAVRLQAQDSYSIPRIFTGVVAAQQRAELNFELSGKLTRITVDEGDRVQQGQVLAELDTALLARERDELRAQRREAKARLDLVEQNLERINSLNEKGYASAQQQDELMSERRVLVATLERLAAALAANQTRLDKSTLHAPFDATVSRRYADLGVVVDPNTAVLRLLEDAPMEARIGVPVRLLDEVTVGAEVALETARTDLAGTVVAIGPDVDPQTRTVPMRVQLPEDSAVVDGELIDLRLREIVNAAGFWVPMTALTEGLRGLWNVYALTPAEAPQRHRLQSRDVRILHAELERAFVTGALASGEQIVAGGLQRLAPGQLVRLADPLVQR